MKAKLLADKTLSPIEKLTLLLIDDWNPIIPFNLLSNQIAKDLGTTRKQILITIGKLEELGLIKCNVGYRTRITKLTKRFYELYN